MLARPVSNKPAAARPIQAKPHEGRFLLLVDGQTKRSFGSLDDATAAGKHIKKTYPIVVVTVLDTADGASHPISI
jgi:hypothetical protein